MRLKQIAAETVTALENGYYINEADMRVNFASQLADCVRQTRYYLPEALAALREQVMAQPARYAHTAFDVINETTLQAAGSLVRSERFSRVAALNFASAKNPGGGFLGGAKAQEESLARSSGLYHSLLRAPDYYGFHRRQGTCLYSDRMIYSPGCPVLRNDDGSWLPQPYLVDFITSPAPNAGAIAQNEPQNLPKIELVLRERASKLLALAAFHECDALVLGAWGCGAFRNDPRMVAGVFHDLLKPDGAYWGRFRYIRFSVLDTKPQHVIFGPFAARFGSASAQ